MTAALVDETAQRLEQLGHAVNLDRGDEAALVGAKEKRRIAQLLAVFASLKVEVKRARLLGDGMRERRLADLPGPRQGHGGLTAQGVLNRFERTAPYHPCILNSTNSICKDNTACGAPLGHNTEHQSKSRATRSSSTTSDAS